MFENNVYVQNFNKYTFLLTELIKRDISGKYKDSTLGLFWSFLNPLLSMIVLTMATFQCLKESKIFFRCIIT